MTCPLLLGILSKSMPGKSGKTAKPFSLCDNEQVLKPNENPECIDLS
jgi:hypothetical protein